MQHLDSHYREEDVENEVSDEDLLHREARSLVLQYLAELDAKDREIAESRKSLTPRERKALGLGPPEDDVTEVVIVEDDTMQIEGGWVFFCQSRKFLETGDSMDMLVGDGPIIVSSSDGALHTTGSAHPPEFYIKNFQKCGRPNG
ncbi:MAG: YrhB family protein [Gammaproteobacteria bacterium]|nr:YrhB family protein [Gammaproteobacteria bacterium]